MALHEIGRGPTHAETILRFLEVPARSIRYHYTNIRTKLSKKIEETTNNSVSRCLEVEKLMTRASDDSELVVYDDRGNIGIAAAMDMHWQIRKDSPSGVTYLVGQLSKKVLSRCIYSRSCRLCFEHQKKIQAGKINAEEEVTTHDCKMNYLPSSSSKGMEANAALEICSKLPETSCYLAKLVIDDDTATLSKLREELPTWMKRPVKYADRNHRVRGFRHQVYGLANATAKVSRTTKSHAARLKRNFAYYIGEMINGQHELQEIVRRCYAIVKHMFNEHDDCTTGCPAVQAKAQNKNYSPKKQLL